jgi:hypothetical protein
MSAQAATLFRPLCRIGLIGLIGLIGPIRPIRPIFPIAWPSPHEDFARQQ